MPFVYIVQCRDGSLYTGYAVDVEERILQHNLGKGAKYTRGRTPVTLCYQEYCADKGEAIKREIAIKKLSRTEKLRLIAQCR